jgi:hypothetical protein
MIMKMEILPQKDTVGAGLISDHEHVTARGAPALENRGHCGVCGIRIGYAICQD